MSTPPPNDITRLLLDLKAGDGNALGELTPLVYHELRQMASRYLRRESGQHTIRTTDLVHEAYLRLINESDQSWENRAHFFAVAARAMRQFLIASARRRKAAKRGGGRAAVTFEDGALLIQEKSEHLLALDEALSELAGFDDRMSRIVELRYFSGLTIEETAEVLGISPATVKRDWTTARAWLYTAMREG